MRVAQIGSGAVHADAYRETLALLEGECELVAFCDPLTSGRSATIEPRWSGLPHFTSVADLLAGATLDAALISGPPADLPAWTESCARAGVHVWVEKPCAARAAQMAGLQDVLREREVRFSCGYTWRHHPVARLLRDAVATGALGTVRTVEIAFATSDPNLRGTDAWLFDRRACGGGALNWLGCHWIDLMRWVLASEVESVTAVETTITPGLEVEDLAIAALRFTRGVTAGLRVGYLTADGAEHLSLALYGSGGWARWDGDRSVWCSADTGWVERWIDAPVERVGGYGNEGLATLRAFFAAIRGEAPDAVRIEDAVAVLEVIEACHESSALGAQVSLAPRARPVA